MNSVMAVTLACILEAASLQKLPPQIVISIMDVEGGRVGMASKNRDGSEDLGPMQVNTRAWLKEIADLHFNGNQNLAYYSLRDHGCYNIHIGTWILRRAIDAENGNMLAGVGRYHSNTPGRKERYQQKVVESFMKIFGKGK
jgi:hypothetical protein